MTPSAKDIIERAGIEYSRDVDISRLSTLGLTASAAFLAYPNDENGLVRLVRELTHNGLAHRVIGGMSNTMPSSAYYDGVLINLCKLNRKTVAENGIFAECGVRLASVINELRHFSLGGLEPLYHIPGTVGGSVRGNAGAHGLEFSDVFLRGKLYDPRTDEICELDRDGLSFAYRHSRMKEEPLLLLSCELRAEPSSPEVIGERIARFGELRKNQPRGAKTLGSTFKRVDGVSAGYYIDRAGLKGLAVGGAEVSLVHAGFIVNRGGATPDDVLRLIDAVTERVYREFGIVLELEIEFL